MNRSRLDVVSALACWTTLLLSGCNGDGSTPELQNLRPVFLGTVTKTWLYPHQMAGWSAVSLGKLGSWFLLLIISYGLVAAVNRPERICNDTQRP